MNSCRQDSGNVMKVEKHKLCQLNKPKTGHRRKSKDGLLDTRPLTIGKLFFAKNLGFSQILPQNVVAFISINAPA